MYLKKHQKGPELPEVFKDRKFNKYTTMADFADENNLPPGIYWLRNDKGANISTAIREVRYKMPGYSTFWVEGRGNI